MHKLAALAFGALAIAYIAAGPSPSRGALPEDPRALAARVAAHPADWLAASALSEHALDMPVRDARELWRLSGALALSLAPLLPDPRTSLARGAFFHWNELSDADRKAVLDAAIDQRRRNTAPGELRRENGPGRPASDYRDRNAAVRFRSQANSPGWPRPPCGSSYDRTCR